VSDVVIVDSGVANLASIGGAFRRLGATVVITADGGVLRQASRIVLPGVGAFAAGMSALRMNGLAESIRETASRGTPLLGICLGMQMLCDASEEAPGVAGLGLVAGTCRRLPREVRIPHLGWNTVTAGPRARFLTSGVAAFANSYALRESPDGWTPAWTTHGIPFVAALERDSIVACQFHPELSSVYGAALLERWLTGQTVRTGAPAKQAPPPGLLRRLIPCLDVQDGRVVKGIRFQNLRDAGDPAEQAARYEAQGADEIVILDVIASARGRSTQLETVRRVRDAIRIPLTVGGGVRSA
jgi:glutamine amidotransferase/cyclase